jgi:hypothetical protein
MSDVRAPVAQPIAKRYDRLILLVAAPRWAAMTVTFTSIPLPSRPTPQFSLPFRPKSLINPLSLPDIVRYGSAHEDAETQWGAYCRTAQA